MKVLIKLLGIVASLAAGAAARKALGAGWRKSTGNEPPKDAGDLQNSLPGVLVFALITAASGAVIHVVTQRLGRKATLRLEQYPGEV
ncbi:DUF4235 domain-containing protein [Arthrobacter sp. TMN-49]